MAEVAISAVEGGHFAESGAGAPIERTKTYVFEVLGGVILREAAHHMTVVVDGGGLDVTFTRGVGTGCA